MPSRGASELRAVARDLRLAGSPGRGLQAKLRRNITAAMLPMKTEVQANARALPSAGVRHTGLRQALANATRIQINTGARLVRVRILVDGKRMPAGQQSLPVLMEGERKWRHPVYGNTGAWVDQPSHPFVAPAVPHHLPAVAKGVDEAVAEIAALLTKKGGL